MNDRLDLLVTDWLRSEAPAHASPSVLDGALKRAATARQDRFVTQWLFGDRVGRRRDVRIALVLAATALALVGAVAIVGALLGRPPKPVGPLGNGAIVFRANGDAGPDLSWALTEVRSGEPDLFAVDERGRPRRIVGDDADHDVQMCPTVSRDGTRLAYLGFDSTTITPTPAPGPSGGAFGPNPSYVGPPDWWIDVVALDGSATAGGDVRRIPIAIDGDAGPSCPHWSPDGTRLAFTIDAYDPRGRLLVVA